MRDLTRLLNPKTIAFIGGRDAAEAVRVCRRFGFEGEIWPISPSRSEMDGIKTFASLDDLPSVPDLAFVGVNRNAALAVVRDLAAKGVGGAIIYASGFQESVAEIDGGAELQVELLAAAGDMPIMGPNCYGIINAATGACCWPSEHGVARVDRGVAILSQSTNIVISMSMQRRALPVAYIGTVGNQAQLGFSDIGAALLEMDHITALGMYVEGIDSAAGFEKLAATARRLGKPIVVVKSGRSEAAAKATLSHTAALAGSDVAADAFFKRLGMARVDSFTEFLETLKLFHVHGALTGNRLSAMSCSGGEAAHISDVARDLNVEFPALTDAHKKQVKDTLSDMVTVSNPLDYHTFIWADQKRMTASFGAMLSGDFDLSFLILDWVRQGRCSEIDWQPAIAAILEAARTTGRKTGVLASLPENMPEEVAEQLMEAGVVPLCGFHDALVAVQASAFVADVWAKPPAQALAGVGNGENESETLDEAASKQALAAFGAPVPIGNVLSKPSDVEQLRGDKYALKALGIAHKTESKAVVLNLTPSGIPAAMDEMTHRLGITRFIAEPMAPKPMVEILIGVTRDAPFGLSLTLGAGGVLAEVMRDSETMLLPCDENDIRTALQRLKIAPILNGYRGDRGADINAIVAAVKSIADYAVANHTTLQELDVNPLMVWSDRALVVDALIVRNKAV